MIIKKVEEIASQPLFLSLTETFAGFPFHLKLEGLNIAGSIKLKTAIHLIENLLLNNDIDLSKIKLIESSSGNLGVALSIVCKSKKLPFTCVIDPNTNANNIKIMKLYGANVICVTQKDENNGYLGTRIKTIQTMLNNDPNLIWINQYENPNNPNAHYLTTAKEIDTVFSKIDYIFIGAGTTGTLMGCLKYFKNHPKSPKIIVVDAEGSVTFGSSAKKRNIPGLGTSKRPPILDQTLIDEVVHIDEKSTVNSCRDFLAQEGLLVGGSTGTVLSAVRYKRNIFKPGDNIIAISPDFGERYLDTVYDDQWVESRLG